jgi:hypothetical protein
MRTTERENKDCSVTEYFQLAHNERERTHREGIVRMLEAELASRRDRDASVLYGALCVLVRNSNI